jgi:hypothetical protein
LQASTYILRSLAEETSQTLSTATNVFAMANPAANPTNLAQALNNHDCAKRSIDIPVFYGHKSKDTIAARLLIARINNAAIIAGWDITHKILEFKMCLRDRAIGWWESP